MSSSIIASKVSVAFAAACLSVVLLAFVGQAESKLLRSRYFDEPIDNGYGLYGSGRTGERAIVTVRGARDTYSGMPPRHLTLESSPYTAGGYPHRGVYDRLDGYGGGIRRPIPDLVPVGPYNGPYGGQFNNGQRFDRYRMNNFDNRNSLFQNNYDAPGRIAVTGVYPSASYPRAARW